MQRILGIAKKSITIRLLFHIVYSVAIASLPYIIKYMIDEVAGTNSVATSWKYIGLFAAMIGIGMAAQYISQKYAWKAEYGIFMELRGKLFSTIMNYPKSRFDINRIGSYTSKIENDVVSAAECMEYATEIVENMLSLIIYAVFIFLLNYKLAMIIYVVTVGTLFLPKLTAGRFSGYKNNLLHATGKYLAKLNDLMQGFYSMSGATKAGVINRHHTELAELEKSRLQYGTFKTFVNVFNGSVMYLIDIVSFAAIAIFLAKGTITVGVAAATITYIREFAAPLRGVIDSVSAMKSVRPAAENVVNEAYEEIEKAPGVPNIACIEMKHITKSYGDFTTAELSCTIQTGKKYLIQGQNGSGKSTLLKMIAQIVTPDTGKILIDGVDLKERDISNTVLYIPQDNHIFAESFWDNVTWFDSLDRTKWDGVDRYFGEVMPNSLKEQSDCSRLSGGEKQQLGLLRTLMSEGNVILLDEPFAAMSPELELKYTRTLLSMKDKTIVMISHNRNAEYTALFDEIITIS